MGTDESADHLTAVTSKVSDQLKGQIDAARKPEESRSAAIRRLIRAGLDAEADDGDTLRDRLLRAGLVALLLGYPTLAAARGAVEIATLFVAFWVVFVLVQPLFTHAVSGLPDPSDWF